MAYHYEAMSGKALTSAHLNPSLHATKPTFVVAYGSCARPCSCDGYEVCLHRIDYCSRVPLWPIPTTATAKAAREVARKIRSWARERKPDDVTETALKAFVASIGFTEMRSRCVVGKRKRTRVAS